LGRKSNASSYPGGGQCPGRRQCRNRQRPCGSAIRRLALHGQRPDPLNVREAPQGRIIGGLHNGMPVRLVDISYDGLGRPWGFILDWNTGRAIGWVFCAYINCY
jgi:hypothetical protein